MKALEVNSIETWNMKGKWAEHKKLLQPKFDAKYPAYKIKINKLPNAGSGKGIINYIVLGIEKEA